MDLEYGEHDTRRRILAAHRLLTPTLARIRALARRIVSSVVEEIAAIKVSKPYKPRRMKNDVIHKLGRQLYKLKSKSPGWKRKTGVYRKKYLQKNGRALKRRHQYVEQVRNRMGLNHKKPGTTVKPAQPTKPVKPTTTTQPVKPTVPTSAQ